MPHHGRIPIKMMRGGIFVSWIGLLFDFRFESEIVVSTIKTLEITMRHCQKYNENVIQLTQKNSPAKESARL